MTFLYTNQLDWSSLKRKNSSVKGIFIIVRLAPMSGEPVNNIIYQLEKVCLQSSRWAE